MCLGAHLCPYSYKHEDIKVDNATVIIIEQLHFSVFVPITLNIDNDYIFYIMLSTQFPIFQNLMVQLMIDFNRIKEIHWLYMISLVAQLFTMGMVICLTKYTHYCELHCPC